MNWVWSYDHHSSHRLSLSAPRLMHTSSKTYNATRHVTVVHDGKRPSILRVYDDVPCSTDLMAFIIFLAKMLKTGVSSKI